MGIQQMFLGASAGKFYEVAKSLRFNSDESSYLNWSPSSDGNRKTFTLSWWMKRCEITTNQRIFAVSSGSSQFSMMFDALGRLYFYGNVSSPTGTFERTTEWSFRDFSAWYHVVLSVDTTQGTDSDRFKMYVNGEEITSYVYSSYPAQNTDMKWNTSALGMKIGGFTYYYYDGYLAEVFHVDGQALSASDFGETNETTGQWLPKDCSGDLTYGTNGFYLNFSNTSDVGEDSSGNGNDWTANNISSIVGNGNHASEVSGTPYNSNYAITNMFNGLTNTYIAASSGSTTWTPVGGLSFTKLRAYLYQDSGTGEITFNWSGGSYTLSFTNATANLTWSDVTSNVTSPVTSIQWNTSGTTGPYVGKWEVDDVELIDNSFSAGSDPSTDTPTNYGDDTGLGGEVRGNYAVLNGNANSRYSGNYTLSEGNLKTVHTNMATLPSTLAVSSGKWYCEGTLNAVANSSLVFCGLMRVDAEANFSNTTPYNTVPIEYWQGNTPLYGVTFWGDGGTLNRNGGQSYGSSYATAGTVIGIAFDADSGSCTWYINGSSQGSSTYNIVQGETYYFVFGSANNGSWTANFGARPFTYAAPSGYKCLCIENLPDPTIADPSKHFDVATASGANILSTATGLTDGADFVWIKDTANGSTNSILFNRLNDTGMDGTPHMRSNTIDKESACGTYSAPSGNSVAWVWNAGSSTVSNTDGSITSSVRANTTAGFSIVSYTGTGSSATVGHGLGAKPGLLITKGRDDSGLSWAVQFLGSASNYMQMSDTGGNNSTDASNGWGSDPTSSVFSINTKATTNNTGTAFIAYVWSEVEGYSKFGRYYGGGGTYGYPFCWTGFKPAFVMIKNSSSTQSWIMWDSERSTYNVADEILNADTANAEAAWADIDILSNGFKIRDTHASVNTNGNWYYFAAFAEKPLKYLNAR